MIRKTPLSYEAALQRAIEMCDRGEFCVKEVMDRLFRWGLPQSLRLKIIKHLEDIGLLDDGRYAESTARGKALYNHWGKIKIRYYLKQKHIADDLINSALEAIDEEEYIESLRAVLTTKKRQLGDQADSYDGRTKIFRHAASKGFEPALIAKLIRSGEY